MKKIIPYILAYVIVATGTAIYPHIYRHFAEKPTIVAASNIVVVLNPGLSQSEFDAKLKQVGLSEFDPFKDKTPPPPARPSALHSLVYHYIFDAVMLAAFAGLVILFRRKFPADVPVQTHAA